MINRQMFSLCLCVLMVLSPIVFCEPPPKKINVVVSVLPLVDFTEAVGGERVDVHVMVPPGANPHVYEPAPSQLKMLSKTDLYVAVGSGIEFEIAWLGKLKAINQKMQFCNSSDGIKLLEAGEHRKKHGDSEIRHERRHSDPHIWLSPKNAAQMVLNIRNSLEKLDPENGKYYRSRAETYLTQLAKLDEDIRKTLDKTQEKSFIVYHPAWSYFAAEYHLEEIPIEADGKEPSAFHLASVIDRARAEHLQTVFVSPKVSQKNADVIAKEIGGKIVTIDDLAVNYVPNMYETANKIARAHGRVES